MTDPFVGSLTFARMSIPVPFRQALPSVLNPGKKNNRERVGRMLLMHANHREDIKEACAG